MEADAGQPRRHLLRRRPARDHRRAGSPRAARSDQAHGRPVHRGGHRPRAVDPVRAVARAGTPAAGLGAEHPHRLRRGGADDPVQRQVGQAGHGCHDPGALRLPDADGRRHPPLRRPDRAGRRRPAPARRTHPRPRHPVQLAVRRDVRGPGGADPEGHREGLRPAGADQQDEQVRVDRQGRHLAARRAGEEREEDQVGHDGQRRRGAFRRGIQARRLQSAHHLLRAERAHGRLDRDRVRGPRLRRLQDGSERGRGRDVRADPRPHARAPRRPRRARPHPRRGADKAAAIADATLATVYDRVGFLPRA